MAQVKLKQASAFRYMGKGNVPLVDLFDITTGQAIYGQDAMLPGMKFAVIARSPVVGGKVASFDASETMKVAGVEKVVKNSWDSVVVRMYITIVLGAFFSSASSRSLSTDFVPNRGLLGIETLFR